MPNKVDMAQLSAANTNRDGTGSLVDLCTGAAFGTRIVSVKIVAVGTTTAGVVRLFIYDLSNTRLWEEILVPAITPGVADQVFEYTLSPSFTLKSGWKLKGATHNAETFNVHVESIDL